MSKYTTYEYRPGFITRQVNSISLNAEKSVLTLSPLSLQRIFLQWALRKSAARPEHKNVSSILIENVLETELTGFISPSILKGQLGKFILYRGRWELPSKYFIIPGNWDIEPLELEENPTYKTMKSLLTHVDDYRKCQAYGDVSGTVADQGSLKFNGRDLSSSQEVDDYFKFYADLALSIKRHGFYSDPEDATGMIGVVLDRDGNFLHFRRGHHRVALARELGVAKIRVRVLSIHPDFLVKFQNASGNVIMQLQSAVSSAFERQQV